MTNYIKSFGLLILIISCKNKEFKENFYESGNLKNKFFLKENDTIKAEYYYDNEKSNIYKQITGHNKVDSVKFYYDNGKIFKIGALNKKGQKKGNWFRHTKDGFLSDVREYFIIGKESIINRQFYFTKDGDTTWYARNFNNYDQEEFKSDTLSSRNSTMNLFDFYSNDTISLKEPFAAAIRCNSPLARKYNSEIAMFLAKENSNFDEDFSNESFVKLDSFPNLKYDKINQQNFTKKTNFNYVAVFGRWFDTPGDKILRGYMKEYFEREPTKDNDAIRGERRVYFEKKIYVLDTISNVDYSKPKKESSITMN